MKFLKYSVFLLTLAFNNLGYTQTLSFTGSSDFRPFYYKDGENIVGAAPELIKLICDEANLECSFKLLPWRRAMKYIQKGERNALMLIGKNQKRTQWLTFSPPILNTEYGFFVKEDNSLKYEKPADMSGYKVSVLGPSNMSHSLETINQQIIDKKMTIDLQLTIQNTLLMLSKDRSDSMYLNRDIGNFFIENMSIANLRYAGFHKQLKYYFAFSKEHASVSQVAQFLKAYERVKGTLAFNKIIEKYNLEAASI